ncbi:lipase secretion chaperone [Paracidovorax sp. MALMAid1276]|uniref:lipase secretion chaperone n=1 Tax=Paracidovorax sp. MALMAid1276 TaxID=3411631 RepID=UPI003B9B64AA
MKKVVAATLAVAALGGAWLLHTAADDSPGAGAGPEGRGARAQAQGSTLPTAGRPGGPGASDFFAQRQAAIAGAADDPLLVDGLRNTLEALLLDAGDASDPDALKQRLAALVGKHFAPGLAARALALAERYVDYRVALGQLRAPKDPTDPQALRESLQARHAVRLRFFDGAEYDALFASEAALDRYTLARLELARNPDLTADQRARALRDAEAELPAARRAERAQATAHLDAAAQTAAFNAQNADPYTRHAARSAQYGEPAAHALAQLDREEQHWQQRLDQYSQARTQQGEGPALDRLRLQLFSTEELARIDAALALRKLRGS